MQAAPVETRNLYGSQILCGGNAQRFSRIQDHLREHHGILAIPSAVECDAVNEAIGEVSSTRSWEHICGNAAPEAQACWPQAMETVGAVVLYAQSEWDRAVAAAESMAEVMPDDEEDC
jgi:hypothetical protein